MKRITLIILCFLLNINIISADNNRISVTLSACVDGDTAKFIYNDKEITARFLAIDTPETVDPQKPVENHGKEASNYTCTHLKKAQKIELEYDSNSTKYDKYNRHLVWVWLDDYLLQNQLVKEGLAEVAYLYGDYRYTPTLQDSETIAKANKIGIWQDKTQKPDNKISIIFGIFISIILILFSTKLTTKQKRFLKNLQKKI